MQLFIVICFLLAGENLWAKKIELNTHENLQKLLQEKDSDGDKKITIDDAAAKKQVPFSLKTNDGTKVDLESTYHQSNLLQELKLAVDQKRSWIEGDRLFENPVTRISRNIKDHYWNHLTRRINHSTLEQVLADPKIRQGTMRYLYVPANDKEALNYFKHAKVKNLEVKTVPKEIDENFLQSLKGKHGLLILKVGTPFVVPGGRFNEMYGWDSYFELLGLIEDERVDLALGLVDNMIYEIEHYGKILNANRSYYLSRSQPPFLTSMIREVLPHLPQNRKTTDWIAKAVKAAIKEYKTVWMGPDHLTPMGLSRYYGYGPEIPPEVEPHHFDDVLKPLAANAGLSAEQFSEAYSSGKLKNSELKTFLIHDQAVRESGHDTTFRWFKNGKESCSDFVTVDLNSLLYKVELDLAHLIKTYLKGSFDGLGAADFVKSASDRKKLIREFLWNPKGGFFDYDWVLKKPSSYVSATAFYPLWAGDILTKAEAEKLVENLLKDLEAPGGLISTSQASVLAAGGVIGKKQWDYPNGWAPHQMLAWQGLRQYGMNDIADRLTYKWLAMITKNAMNYNGTIPEKYDVVKMSHDVFAEYGNVGTKFSYITTEGFGWMNASYQVGLKTLAPKEVEKLKALK